MSTDIQIHDHINGDDDFPFTARIGHGGIVTVGGDPTSCDPFVVVTSEGYPNYPQITLSLHGGNYTYQQGTPALTYTYAHDRSRPVQFWADKIATIMGCVCPLCDAPIVRSECGGSGEGICGDSEDAAPDVRSRIFGYAQACHASLVTCEDLTAFESR